VLAPKSTRGLFDAYHLKDARQQSPGACTQSVMSTVTIRSNRMGCESDILFKKDLLSHDIRPQDLLYHEPTLVV